MVEDDQRLAGYKREANQKLLVNELKFENILAL